MNNSTYIHIPWNILCWVRPLLSIQYPGGVNTAKENHQLEPCTSSFTHVQEPHPRATQHLACGESSQEKEARHSEGEPWPPGYGEERPKTQRTQP